MIDVKVKLVDNSGSNDSTVSAMTKIVRIPNRGDYLYLDDDVKEELMTKIKSSIDVANIYLNYWSSSSLREISNKSELKRVKFCINRAVYINSVIYSTNSPIVCLEMDFDPEL